MMDVSDRITSLPPRAKEFFESNDIRLNMERAALAYQIPEEKMGILARVVGEAFLSIIDVAQMSDEITKKAGLEKSIANGLCLDLTKKIFQPFPEVFKNVEYAVNKFSIDAAAPKLSQNDVEKELNVLEPWLGKEAPTTVLEKRAVISSSAVSKIATIRMPLLKAMSEYRHIPEQMITNEKIKLKTSTEPARPTLGNWLKVYREELGIGFHETALRGNFLFQSQNGKRLSSDERARLNLILKSLEEEFPLEIDPKAEVIVFPAASNATMEQTTRPAGGVLAHSPAEGAATPSNPQRMKPLFGQSSAPEKNVSGETLHFSTGHVLPAEREGALPGVGGNAALREMQHPTQGIKRPAVPAPPKSPYSIRPMRLRSEDDQAQ